MELIQVVYASAAKKPFSQFALTRLLLKARRANAAVNVSGILLYFQESFFQVLEGPADTVEMLFEKIQRDPRHHRMLLISNTAIPERNFGDWKMGFINLETVMEKAPGFLRLLDPQNTVVDSVGYQKVPSRSGEKAVPALNSISEVKTPLLKLYGNPALVRRLIEGFERGRWRQR